jgi:putative transposase
MTRSRYRVLQNPSPHFLTATINQWLPLFTRPATVNIVLDSWRFLQRESGFQLYGYVILENHLHLIASSPDLSRDMQRFKAYTAKQIIAHLQQSGSERVLKLLALLKRPHKIESDYQVWEEGSHPQCYRSVPLKK